METVILTSTARAETVPEISAPPTLPFVEDPHDPPGGPPHLALAELMQGEQGSGLDLRGEGRKALGHGSRLEPELRPRDGAVDAGSFGTGADLLDCWDD